MILRVVAVVAALAHLLAEDLLGPVGPFVKAIPVAVMALLVFRRAVGPGRNLAAFGLMVAALADLVIEFSFLGGLATFLMAHLFSHAAFTRIEPQWRFLRLIPVAVWAALALPVLVGHAGSLAVPVLVYGLVIFGMIWRAAALVSVPGWNNPTIALAGAILFGISDTLLGYSPFVPQGQAGALAPGPWSDFLIMGTYWGGQFLIAVSFLRAR